MVDAWVKAAVADDTAVAALLMSLRSGGAAKPNLPLEWSVRQRRSNAKKQPQSQRASPTTPLSWSGATSVSGGSGAGVSEESSRMCFLKPIRSEVNEDAEKNPSKRSRKKKTLAQLKDEEISLLRERKELKRRIAITQLNLEKHSAENEMLKKMKVESQPKAPLETDEKAAFVLPDLNIPLEDNIS